MKHAVWVWTSKGEYCLALERPQSSPALCFPLYFAFSTPARCDFAQISEFFVSSPYLSDFRCIFPWPQIVALNLLIPRHTSSSQKKWTIWFMKVFPNAETLPVLVMNYQQGREEKWYRASTAIYSLLQGPKRAISA